MDIQFGLNLVAGALFVIFLGAIAWIAVRWSRSRRLKKKFGTEYDYLVNTLGDRGKAETELELREKHADELNVHPLDDDVQERYLFEWNSLQNKFVDRPLDVVIKADRLINEVMVARGFPIGNFEERVANISILYPDIVTNYRKAWEIVRKNEPNEASTEDLRLAMLCYRSLLDELLVSDDIRVKEK